MGLRQWIQRLNEIGELRVVNDVDWNLELGAVVELNQRIGGPALLFDNIKGYPAGFRVLNPNINNARRLAITVGLESDLNDRELCYRLRKLIADANDGYKGYDVREVLTGHVKENEMSEGQVNLLEFPSAFWHEHDGGRNIATGGLVISKHHDSDWVNLGCYNAMILDERTVSVQMGERQHGAMITRSYWERGEACPVAVSVGQDPLLWVVAGTEVPGGVPEYNYAGALRGKSYEVIRGDVTGLPIPADSEIVLEGFIPPNIEKAAGPFGEFTGYYVSSGKTYPIIEVKKVYYRNDPIILGARVGKPPHDHSYWRNAMVSALMWDQMEQHGIPEVRGVWCHSSAVRYLTVVSVKQMYAGHSKAAGIVASQLPGASSRYVIVVDDDIDPTNIDEVLWAVGTRTDPATNIDFIRGVAPAPLDPLTKVRAADEQLLSKAVIDACIPYNKRNDFPRVAEASEELKQRVTRKYGFLKG